jgi:hypothetical protein
VAYFTTPPPAGAPASGLSSENSEVFVQGPLKGRGRNRFYTAAFTTIAVVDDSARLVGS